MAFQQALEVYTREQDPELWVHVQFSLGRAFFEQSETTKGQEKTRLLESAAAAFQQASEGLTREGRPKDWALKQFQLGDAFRRLAQKTSGEDRARLFQAALAAFRQALEVFTPHYEPQKWAASQMGRGGVLYLERKRAGWCRREAPPGRGGSSVAAGVGGIYP